MRCRAFAPLLLSVAALACVRGSAEGALGPGVEAGSTPTPISSSSAPTASEQPDASGEQTEAPPPTPPTEPSHSPMERLRLAMEQENFVEARAMLEQMPGEPAAELVTGYVELQLGQYDWAAEKLSAAKQNWPTLDQLIEPWLRKAQLHSSDWESMLEDVATSRDTDELLLFAERLLDKGRDREAWTLTVRAAAFTRGSKRRQAEVRALRARVALALGQNFTALADWRWLALQAPLEEVSEAAPRLIATHFPKSPLRPEERYLRATKFADAGRVAETDTEIQSVIDAPYYKVRPGDALHLQALARYRARQFEVAAEWLLQAAKEGSHQGLRDTYYAARALSRAGRVQEAIALYEQVAGSHPKGPITQSARFRLGSEWLVMGEWQAAVKAHTAFLNNYADNEHTEAARRERAIAWFALGEHRRAAYWFARLRGLAPDSSDAKLYQLLEAVAREHSGDTASAILLMRDLELNSPLSFAGHQSRARLIALGEEVHPLAVKPNDTPALAPFPAPVPALERFGLSYLSEQALLSQESQWLDSVEAVDGWAGQRGQAQCSGYGLLAAGRRRFVVGIDLANKSGFFNRPRDSQDWLWRCVYPTPYLHTVQAHAEQWQTPPALVYAVMRQESGFHSSIESPAAARGLMQIIPPTAERIAQELGDGPMPGALDSPYHNIRYGTFYLSKLLRLFDGHPAPAVAAYNAGPEAALRWRAATKDLPLEVFVARINFSETRNYVQRVLGNLRTYEAVYPQFGSLDWPMMLTSTTSTATPMSGQSVPMSDDLY